MRTGRLIFSDSSDDEEGAGNHSTDSSASPLKLSHAPPAAALPQRHTTKEAAAAGQQWETGSRGSSCSQLRNSRLSTRVSRQSSKSRHKPGFGSPFSIGSWGESGRGTLSTVVEQSLVQAFKGEMYVGTCIASISASVPRSSSSSLSSTIPTSPLITVEDAKGNIQCQLPLTSAVLTPDSARPKYVFLDDSGVSGGERWALMFQGQGEVTRFFVCATTSLAVHQQLIPQHVDDAPENASLLTLFNSSSPSPLITTTTTSTNSKECEGSPLVRHGETVQVSYALWQLSASPTGLLGVGELVEDATREAPARVTAGEGRWLFGLDAVLVGMKRNDIKVVCITARSVDLPISYVSSGWGLKGKEKTKDGTGLWRGVAWISCVGVPHFPGPALEPPPTAPTTALAEAEGDGAAASHRSSLELQETLTAIQRQIMSLQHSFTQMPLGGRSIPQGDQNVEKEHLVSGSPVCDALNQTVLTRAKTPARQIGRGGAVATEGPIRSVKRLCNAVYQDIEYSLDSFSPSVRTAVLEVVANSVQRCGGMEIARWRKQARAVEDRSPPPSLPRDYTGWSPLKEAGDPNVVNGRSAAGKAKTRAGPRRQMSSGSRAGQSSGMDEFEERSGSAFATPPPRPAVLLGSQDFRGSPTPVPLHPD